MAMKEEVPHNKDPQYEEVYFFSTFWWGLYIGAAIVMSVVLLVVVLFPLGISVRSDFVFGVLALVSGLLADLIFRKGMKRKMMISRRIRYSILYAWIPLCLYVMIWQPLE